jgi:hypothetical protein
MHEMLPPHLPVVETKEGDQMNWRFNGVFLQRHGNCSSWVRVARFRYFGGNIVVFKWGRFSLEFERNKWKEIK